MKNLDVRTYIQLKNVLFATDFSHAANAAVPYAREIVSHYGANLYAFHVRPASINPMAPPETWTALEVAAEEIAVNERKKLLDTFGGLHPHILLSEGDLWTNLSAAIIEYHIDLIVAGTRGRSGLSKFMLGSAAEEIFRQVPCPTLIVNSSTLVESAQIGKFKHILFATGLNPRSATSGRYAVSFAREYHANLTLLHVMNDPAVSLTTPSEIMLAFMDLLREIAPTDDKGQQIPKCLIERGSIAQRILEVAAHEHADLIVLGVRQPNTFPWNATHLPMATAHKVVSQATCPVLVVPS